MRLGHGGTDIVGAVGSAKRKRRTGKAALVGLARGDEGVDVVQELGGQEVQECRDDEEAVCSPVVSV